MSDVDTPSPETSSNADDSGASEAQENGTRARIIKWCIVIASAVAIAFIPVPQGITPQS